LFQYRSFTVSSWSNDDGDTQVTITARARPPSESASKWVSFEFRYGMCPPPPVDGDEADEDEACWLPSLRKASRDTTKPNCIKLRLIWDASLRMAPVAPVRLARSDLWQPHTVRTYQYKRAHKRTHKHTFERICAEI